jgi:diguanylate cyclase (GGDEF)-like protein
MTLPPDLLIVDDTPQNIDVLSECLAGLKGRIRAATSGERALELARRQPPDLILLDVMMPGIDGFETCRRLKADPATASVPVIFVTARHDDIAEGFRAGGVDYITKPIQTDEVRARVNHQLERLALLRELQTLNRQLEDKVRERTAELTLANHQLRQEINERRYMQDRLNYLATHDFVTRLYNRSALDAHASELLARVQRERAAAVFLLIDVDQFRLINESCGCIAGDELLRSLADSLAGALGPKDFFARLGGDQFGIVSEEQLAEQGLALARRLQAILADFRFDWDSHSFRLSTTIGVVPLDEDILSFEQLMLRADETVYLAKQDGPGSTRRWQAQGAGVEDHRASINWPLLLLDALKQQRFQVHVQRLQPLQPPTAGAAAPGLRLETLLRLWDPQRQQMVLPAAFIPPAERFHVVQELDRWMLGEVLRFLGEHPDLIGRIDQVNVNLSALTMREAGLDGRIIELLNRHAVPPRLLCFELTETEAIVNLAVAREFMRRLSAHGCRFVLDDFGSGFASFAYLRELPFDAIKIDGQFVRDMDRDPTHATLVQSMVEMAHQLGKPVVAECVETQAVADLLAAQGVEWAQGFHFHRPEPVTAERIRQWQG